MPKKEHETDQSQKLAEITEDEIELIDLLRIIWKWKYLIIGGTLFCTLAAIGLSYFMPKIYQIDMVLRPGILNIGKNELN